MRNTITALELFEQGLTKTDIKNMAANAVVSVMEEGNILKVAEALAAMETFIKEVKASEDFKNYTREEAGKYPKGYISPSGAKIELAETGSVYDYSDCNDSFLADLEIKSTEAELEVKRRKEFLKTVPQSGLDIMTSEAELIKIFPPSKKSTSSYKITLAR